MTNSYRYFGIIKDRNLKGSEYIDTIKIIFKNH